MKLTLKTFAIASSLAFMCALVPLSAYATDSASELSQTKTLQWSSAEDTPVFDETIELDGVTYTLTSSPEIEELSQTTPTVPATWSTWVECWPEDLEATKASFPDTYRIEKQGYAGDIPCTGVTYVPTQAQETSEVNVTQTYTGLMNNDASSIPEMLTQETEWGNTVELTLCGLTFEVETYDEYGAPKTYSATALYRGLDTRTVVDHYRVTATYAGDIPATEPVTTYTATLNYSSPAEAKAESTPVVESKAEPASQTPKESTPDKSASDFPFAALAAALAALVVIIIVPLWRRSNLAKFTHVTRDADKGTETRKVVGTARVKRIAGELIADAKKTDLSVIGPNVHCCVELPKKYANSTMPFKLTQYGKTIYSGAAAPKIRVLSV